MKKWFFSTALVLALAACNNSGGGSEVSNDTNNLMNNTQTNPQNQIDNPAGADTLGRDTLRDSM
jgi:hypothetical protein